MCYKITESKKMELSTIHESLPPEMVEKILKLLNCKDIYQSQLVCRRWKEIIDKGNLKKKATGKTSLICCFLGSNSVKLEIGIQPLTRVSLQVY